MICPECKGVVKTVDTVHIRTTNETYRRKRCLECGHTFYTAESIAPYDNTYKNRFRGNHRMTIRMNMLRKDESC